ncbi:MAG TPA: arginine deiminase family protein [Solirubrobacteraceae bacterium]|nr:arginine deiminase family protein [Solirubrobacteraceae bacterium]
MSTAPATALGVHSEVGTLRAAIVHRPDLAHERLCAANCRELAFDEVIWVRRARQEFDQLLELMRAEGVEVLLLHELLEQTLADRDAREWLLSRRLCCEETTSVLSREVSAWAQEIAPDELARSLTGGILVHELPAEIGALARAALPGTDFVLAPLPNQLFTRDASAWLYGGVLISAMHAPARRMEALNVEAIYRFHPRFRDYEAPVWFGGADHDWGEARLEGGDVMAVGAGVVLVGHSERGAAAAASMLAQTLFEAGEARLVIGAALRGPPAPRLETILTFCDRDLVLVREPDISRIVPVLYSPDGAGGVAARTSERSLLEEVGEALGVSTLTVVCTGGDQLRADGRQWDDGSNVLALAPGSVLAYERNETTNYELARAGVEVHTIAAQELGRGRERGGRRLTCPIIRDA